MIHKGKLGGILAAIVGKPKEGAEPDSELDSCIKEVARSIKELDTSAIEDSLHRLVECISSEDKAEDAQPEEE